MKYELQQMRSQGSGAIVNCSSIGGLVGGPGRAAYHGSKHAIMGLPRSAALEYAPHGIRINAVCPGTIETPMVADMVALDNFDTSAAIASQPIGRWAVPTRSRLRCCGSAAPSPALSSACRRRSTAATQPDEPRLTRVQPT